MKRTTLDKANKINSEIRELERSIKWLKDKNTSLSLLIPNRNTENCYYSSPYSSYSLLDTSEIRKILIDIYKQHLKQKRKELEAL